MAVWMPVMSVPTSEATVAIDTFMTELSRVIRNWAEASVMSTRPAAAATGDTSPGVVVLSVVLMATLRARGALDHVLVRPDGHGGVRPIRSQPVLYGRTAGATDPSRSQEDGHGVVQAGEDGQVPDAQAD